MNKNSLWSRGGVLLRARQIATANQDLRPVETTVRLLVIHGISLPSGQFGGTAIEKLFTNKLDHQAHESFSSLRGLRVSAHFLIRRGGSLIQFVACDRRAWHAGVSIWGGQERCNDFSIGVELEGADHVPYSLAQYRQLARLTREILDRYPILAIVGHSDIARVAKPILGRHSSGAAISHNSPPDAEEVHFLPSTPSLNFEKNRRPLGAGRPAAVFLRLHRAARRHRAGYGSQSLACSNNHLPNNYQPTRISCSLE